MAKPVKETPILFGEEARQFEVKMLQPILFGEEARQFEVKMLHPKPLPRKQAERIRRDYEFLRGKCVNCSF